MNRIVSFLLAAASICAVHSAEPKRLYHELKGMVQDTTFTASALPATLSASLELRAEFVDKKMFIDNKLLKKQPNIISFSWKDNNKDLWKASFLISKSGTDELLDESTVELTVIKTLQNDTICEQIYKNVFSNVINDINTEFSLCIDLIGNEAAFMSGQNSLKEMIVLGGNFNPSTSIDITVEGKIDISSLVREYTEDMISLLYTGLPTDSILNMATHGNQPVGIWKALDRDTDSRYAQQGGRYTLAIIPTESHDCFNIIYLNGAEVNADIWKPGMKKGQLITTPFIDHYDLKWYDSNMELIEYDATAGVEQDIILSLSFPLLKSTLRFVRSQD